MLLFSFWEYFAVVLMYRGRSLDVQSPDGKLKVGSRLDRNILFCDFSK